MDLRILFPTGISMLLLCMSEMCGISTHGPHLPCSPDHPTPAPSAPLAHRMPQVQGAAKLPVDIKPLLERLKAAGVTADERGRILAVVAAAQAHTTVSTKADGGQRANWGAEAASRYKALVASAKEEGIDVTVFSDTTAAKLIRKWWDTFLTTGTVHDGQRTGRHARLPESAVAAALKHVKQRHPYSMQHAESCPVISAILQQYGVTVKTLWERMKDLNPKLSKTLLVEYKHKLTRRELDERIDQCVLWLQLGVKHRAKGVKVVDFGPGIGKVPLPPPPDSEHYHGDWLTNRAKSHLFIDEKTVYVSPMRHHVWTVTDDTPTSIVIEDPRIMSQVVVIKYASAVNGKMGGILLKPLSGTRGLGYQHPKTYMVRVTWQHAGLPACYKMGTGAHGPPTPLTPPGRLP